MPKATPVQGAVSALKEVSGLFDTYLLSTAPWENPSSWSDKVWVTIHLGESAYKHLILSHHKNLNRDHFIVDDRTKNGVDKFDDQHIQFGTARFPDCPSVVDYLRAHAG